MQRAQPTLSNRSLFIFLKNILDIYGCLIATPLHWINIDVKQNCLVRLVPIGR